MANTVSASDVTAAVKAAAAIGEAIRDLGEVPSGVLYANVMASGMTLHAYTAIIGVLKRAKLVEETPGHLLRWIGPTK